MRRSRSYLIAAILASVIGSLNTLYAIIYLPQGESHSNSAHDVIPYWLDMVKLIVGLMGLVAAYGVFRQLRWAVVLTILLMVVNIFVALPGIPLSENPIFKILASLFIALCGTVVYLLLRRDSRPLEVSA